MTDKQIIYDDLEVSKCKYYNNGWCLLSESCDQIKYKSCHDMTLFDCYYKQLKSKEQECDMLKETLKTKAKGWANVNDKILEEVDQLKADNKHLNDLLNQALKELEQSREAIEKIKEMCSSVENIENANTLYESKLSGMYLQARKILQICDEVNDER